MMNLQRNVCSQPDTAEKNGSVVIHEVTKQFRKHTLRKKSYSTLKTSIVNRLFTRPAPQENLITALNKVSIEIPSGSAVGIIGRNGSGKSTLLKLLAGIYRPDRGSVEVHGRISALIELGAGFHPDFTGRENVFLNGIIHGLSRKQIEQRFDDIVAYAGLEDFVDDPVRTYSSGMYMRLGFSVAVHTDPDILLVDEVLSVGDAAFVHQCHETISEFRRQGKTLILVTHDLASVERWCNEAVWLDQGLVRQIGEPRHVIDTYLNAIHEEEEKILETQNEALNYAVRKQRSDGKHGSRVSAATDNTRWGNLDVEITSVLMKDNRGEERWLFASNDQLSIEVTYVIHRPVPDLVFGIGVLRADGLCIYGTNTDLEQVEVPLPEFSLAEFPLVNDSGLEKLNGVQGGKYVFHIKRVPLVEGAYFCDVAAHAIDGSPFDYHHLRYRFSIRSHEKTQGVCLLEHEWQFQADYPIRQSEKKQSIGGSR